MFLWLWQLFEGPDAGMGLSARSLGAAIMAFAIGMIFARRFKRTMRRWGITDKPKEFGGLNVLTKTGVPTMGGALILMSTFAAVLAWCDLSSAFVWITVGAGLYFGVVGAVDDFLKARTDRDGLSRGAKYALQIAMGLALAVVVFLPLTCPLEKTVMYRTLFLPLVDNGIHLGFFIIPIVIFFIVFSSNSVNLTDGMDGLAIVPVVFLALVLGAYAYLGSNVEYAELLRLYVLDGTFHKVTGAGELTVLCSAIVGSGAAFLWHNAHPASLFMGDTGSLALGGMLGAVAVLIRQEVIFLIAGGLLVAELASSFIQHYIGLKLLGRRIFPRAPLHLALLHRGTGETKVTIRLWIVAAVCALAALCCLKL